MGSGLKQYLIEHGATVVGFGAVTEALGEEIAHLERAVSIGVDRKLTEDTVHLLHRLQKLAAKRLKEKGYRYLIIPPDSDRRDDTFISKLYDLFSHKVAATCSGIGWVGKNGLLISAEYGPRLSIATVLTNAPLEVDKPIDSCMCGTCSLCVKHCPARAIKGRQWSRHDPFPALIDYEKCRSYKSGAKNMKRKPNCGLCITICPYGRKAIHEDISENNSTEDDRCLTIR
jgi:epoxyqueuosine reductase